MNTERLDRMRKAMEAARLDGLILRLPENVLLLSGFWPMIGASTLLFPRDGKASILIPAYWKSEAMPSLWEAEPHLFEFGVLGAPDPASTLRDVLSSLARKGQWKRIGYEGGFTTIAPSWQSGEALVPTERTKAFYEAACPGSELVDATALIQTERSRKTAFEAAKLRIVAEISCIGMEVFQGMVEPGVSGIDLVAAVEAEIMRKGIGYKGAQRVRAYAQVATGSQQTAIAYRMHEISTTRPLRDGDATMLELGVVADGYWADRTRVRVAGQPSDEQSKIFAALSAAQQAAIDTIRPGVTGAQADEAARAVIRDAGYGDAFPHLTGHGLGFGYHESLVRLSPGSKDVLEEGMLTSVEPGIYLDGPGGFRIEDDVLVTQDGREVLGPFRKEL
ncbi:MAG TPA: Xaa-Pro peptidase family protein [Bryobacteraceae bacterium]|nr:Xaa-Pro peptidase family protein [Bryobacteraceae bacterium]